MELMEKVKKEGPVSRLPKPRVFDRHFGSAPPLDADMRIPATISLQAVQARPTAFIRSLSLSLSLDLRTRITNVKAVCRGVGCRASRPKTCDRRRRFPRSRCTRTRPVAARPGPAGAHSVVGWLGVVGLGCPTQDPSFADWLPVTTAVPVGALTEA
ncbi:hypothetical protein LX32DRAFT_195918 [Colletotrichum zoysiae]|uniref:Uncharacterized protein n=1 Tax=Colletotrichum zoysiae TaxID=1216348 RepID=A0AAD9HQJ0_9PEZI|nr:hypothetical protein LX32DRAFT_195918 [Colletotrichum zoysiae]